MYRSLRMIALCLVVFLVPIVGDAQGPVDTLRSLSANSGLYSNRIPEMGPQTAFTEVCIANQIVVFDPHDAAEPSTVGGSCEPGSVGWVIEKIERSQETWEGARMECLREGMRLPEPFEWKWSCKNAGAYELVGMTDGFEWASNFATHQSDSAGQNFIGAAAFGSGACEFGTWGAVGRDPAVEGVHTFRCVM